MWQDSASQERPEVRASAVEREAHPRVTKLPGAAAAGQEEYRLEAPHRAAQDGLDRPCQEASAALAWEACLAEDPAAVGREGLVLGFVQAAAYTARTAASAAPCLVESGPTVSAEQSTEPPEPIEDSAAAILLSSEGR